MSMREPTARDTANNVSTGCGRRTPLPDNGCEAAMRILLLRRTVLSSGLTFVYFVRDLSCDSQLSIL